MNKASDLMVDQMRAIDNRRLVKGPLLRRDDEKMETVRSALAEVLGLAE